MRGILAQYYVHYLGKAFLIRIHAHIIICVRQYVSGGEKNLGTKLSLTSNNYDFAEPWILILYKLLSLEAD